MESASPPKGLCPFQWPKGSHPQVEMPVTTREVRSAAPDSNAKSTWEMPCSRAQDLNGFQLVHFLKMNVRHLVSDFSLDL